MDNDIKEFRERKQYEHELINRRLTWLLTSQSLLFAAYGLVFTSDNLNDQTKVTHAIAWFGGIIAGAIWLGIVASIIASCYLWRPVIKKEELGVKTWTTILSWCTDVSLPLVFIGAWCYLYSL